MRILFLDPPHAPWDFFPGRMPSPGLMAIVPFAVGAGCDVAVLDLSLEIDPAAALEKKAASFAPDVVAISGSKSAFAFETANAAMLARKFLPAAVITGGGNFASSYAGDLVSRGLFDIIIKGEGELPFSAILKALKKNKPEDIKDIAGLIYSKEMMASPKSYRKRLSGIFSKFEISRAEGFRSCANVFDREKIFEFEDTGSAEFIADMDTLPLPAFEYFDMDSYTLPPLGGKTGFVQSFSRGCGKRCSFCADSLFWGHTWRGFSAERCVEILKTLSSAYGRRIIYFGDADFFWNRNRNLKFLELLEKEREAGGLKINFWLQSSVDNILANRDLLKRYRKAGLYQIMCGFESVSGAAQSAFKKVHSIDKMTEAARAVKNAGIIIMGMMMWGDYGDDEITLGENLDFLVKNCDVIGPNTVTPHYGTPYFEECEKRGLVTKYSTLGSDQCYVIMPTYSLDISGAEKVYKDMVLKTLISKKKFIGNYLSAPGLRIKKILSDLIENGYEGKAS
ncbi:MAG TPA: radical SAM protein [Candidatus Wallbacteria bacterium]|nr:radical SAM protein [Candidatus Wallbacteria bacterium]